MQQPPRAPGQGSVMENSPALDLLALHASLEPAVVSRTLDGVCAKRFGCRASILVFAGKDHNQIREFGVEDGAVETAPATETAAAIPLLADGETVGFLRFSGGSPDFSAADGFVELLRASLGYAVRNAQVFDRTRRLTFTDDLTALYNSRFMSLYLEQEIKRCRRTRSPMSLLFMDLDGFKAVNDTHGHLAGSRTLVEVGGLLAATVRDADVLIRYGGDEFVIVFPETPLNGALVIAERIRQVIAAKAFLATLGMRAHVSASIGIAAYPESAEDIKALISGADAAMYRAKALGKNRVVAANPIAHDNRQET